MVLKRPNKNPTQVGWKVQWTHAIFIRNILAMFHCLCFTPGTWLISPLETRKDLDYQRSPTSPSRWDFVSVFLLLIHLWITTKSCSQISANITNAKHRFHRSVGILGWLRWKFLPRNSLKFCQTSSVFSFSRLKQGRKDGQILTIWICDCSMVGKSEPRIVLPKCLTEKGILGDESHGRESTNHPHVNKSKIN